MTTSVNNCILNMYCDGGEIGRHKRLKISRSRACRFDSGPSHQAAPVAQWSEQRTHNPLVLGSSPSGSTISGVSIMDNTGDFYSLNRGSIPLRRTNNQ